VVVPVAERLARAGTEAVMRDACVRAAQVGGREVAVLRYRAGLGTLCVVAARSKPVEQAADELYALPPGEFTRARDERAKALRKAGDRDEADAVKALRKPTVAAWALNQLARRRPKQVDGLVAAGEDLRAAQDELLAGGDRKAFQSAAATERDQVAKLAQEAVKLAAEDGERASPALTEKITATLHAAALDEETAEELRAGRLVREREAIGGFGGMTAEPAKRRQTASGGAKRTNAAVKDAKREAGGADAKRSKASDAKRRADAERREQAERRQRVAAARTDERHARRELDAAAKAIEHAESRAEAARVHAEEANQRAKTTAERLKEARREQAAAKKAHARAQRALEAAEAAS
jgi:hypothetical protein